MVYKYFICCEVLPLLSAVGTKFKEAVFSVAPIALIVLALAFTIAPLNGPTVLLFALSAAVLIFGMTLFTLGSEIAMTPMGELVGARLSEKRSLPFLVVAALLMGAVVTIAEPDLTVLAAQVPAFPNSVLIFSVAVGVGVFLVLGLLRIVLRKRLNLMLLIFYALVFLLAIFADNDFLPVAFDSGGVTTGPITVPFILALGVGVAAVRGGQSAEEDSFGLVALCSIGPILAVLTLALFFDPSSSQYAPETPALLTAWGDVLPALFHAFPHYLWEVTVALLPILLAFCIFQIFWLKLPARRLMRMASGIVYTLVGLCLFLAAVNVGFLPVGYALGSRLAALSDNWLLVPLAMLMGFFIVRAEPAVHVLNEQVAEITDGAIGGRALLHTLSLGVAASLGLAMVRMLTGLSIWYFVLPGYALALGMSFFVPRVFTAIAFDSGGVASGPMTATFLLPFALGAVDALGGDPMADAFGLVAMVAMTPLLAIQALALVYAIRARKQVKPALARPAVEIIDFEW